MHIRSKSQLKTIPCIEKFFNNPKHCQYLLFALEMRLCRKNNYEICGKIGRNIHALSIKVNDYNLQDKIL